MNEEMKTSATGNIYSFEEPHCKPGTTSSGFPVSRRYHIDLLIFELDL